MRIDMRIIWSTTEAFFALLTFPIRKMCKLFPIRKRARLQQVNFSDSEKALFFFRIGKLSELSDLSESENRRKGNKLFSESEN